MIMLPCPFCNHQPNIDDGDTLYPINRSKTSWQFYCTATSGGCDASVVGNSRDDAIRRWNTRATVPLADFEQCAASSDQAWSICNEVAAALGEHLDREAGSAESVRQIIAALQDKLENPVLKNIEQYQLQMAAISTAAIGYWKEEDSISAAYDTIALRDVAKLYTRCQTLHDILYGPGTEQV